MSAKKLSRINVHEIPPTPEDRAEATRLAAAIKKRTAREIAERPELPPPARGTKRVKARG